jgi:Phasin protein
LISVNTARAEWRTMPAGELSLQWEENGMVMQATGGSAVRADWAAPANWWLESWQRGLAQLAADIEAQNRSAIQAAADCRDPGALFALQANLATGYAESVLRYWTTVAGLAGQTNANAADFVREGADRRAAVRRPPAA